MPLFTADHSKCRKDGICSRLCPMLIIKDNAEGFPEAVESRVPTCIDCGHCVAFCPHNAAHLDSAPGENSRRIDKKLMPSVEQASTLIRSRRSIRSFSDKPVPKELIDEILTDCGWAPTAKNARKMRWVVVNTPEQIRKVNSLTADGCDHLAAQEPDSEISALYKRLAGSWRKGFDPFLRGAKQLLVCVGENNRWGVSDMAIALSYFELLAHAHGIGCCWAGYFTTVSNSYRPLADYLGLQADEQVGGGQMFGYPVIKPSAFPHRAKLDVKWLE